MARSERRGPPFLTPYITLVAALAQIPHEDVSDMQLLLGRLNDVDSMKALDDERRDGESAINIKEACGDWSGALQAYEQAIILHESVESMQVGEDETDLDEPEKDGGGNRREHRLEKGLLRSLLNIGQLESVLNQVGGMMNRHDKSEEAGRELLPSAIEAAWRLQKWPLLDDLLKRHKIDNSGRENVGVAVDPEDGFRLKLGEIMHRVWGAGDVLGASNAVPVANAIKAARSVVMADLATTSGESYTRSLGSLMKLHTLREIEQVVGSADVEERMTSDRGEIGGELSAGWDWVGRLKNLGSTNR